MTISEGDTVTVDYVGRFEDGTVFDTSRQSVAESSGLLEQQPDRTFDPLTIEIGAGELIDGFESALFDLEAGDEVSVTIPPTDAYGEWDEDRVRSFSRDEIDQIVRERDVEEGMYLESHQGTFHEVVSVSDTVVEVDFNHRLAGETLEFEIEVIEVEHS